MTTLHYRAHVLTIISFLTFVLQSQILEIADICCQGRVVSVLEGGYGRTSRQQAQAAAAATASDNAGDDDSAEPKLDKSVFAECAFQHVQALVDPFDE
jgi:acetoin utilization deacetylase AcuC-like enzyme